jgi:nickel/cobalt exporter
MTGIFALLQTGTAPQQDALAKLLHQPEITPWMIAAAVGIAFVLGAAHALTPGHGKTIVAAYLVGSRGTLKHAAFLGAMVTFTHTVSVFLLGMATLFLFHYVVPENITRVLGAISGLSIVGIGAWMLYKRLRGTGHTHSNDHHDHEHQHDHVHPHDHHHHDHAHHHDHPHDHAHEHDPHAHSHMPDEVSWSGLVALGASGGLVPCESALVLLLSAIALRRVGLGLLLLVSFSLGLAIVLMGIGVLVIYAKNLLPESKRTSGNPFFRWMPVASAAVVLVLGLLMTGVSLGWIQPKWMAG